MENNSTDTQNPKMEKFRALMKEEDIDCYVLFMGDAHDTEYPGKHDTRIACLCGFTGSAGTCLVTQEGAYFWTDGRYFMQANLQLEKGWTMMKMGLTNVPTLHEFIKKTPSCTKLGYDAKTTSMRDFLDMKKSLDFFVKFKPLQVSPVDTLWGEKQPPNLMNPIYSLPITVTGKSCATKFDEIREKMSEAKCTALVTTALDEVAWLFNLRGSDIPDSPMFYGFGFLTMNECYLFTNKHVMTDDAIAAMENEPVQIESYDAVNDVMQKYNHLEKIWIDPRCNYSICANFPFENCYMKSSPIALMKAIKNESEMACMKEVHIKDGSALCRFLHWCEKERDYVTSGNFSELDLADKAKWFRSKNPDFLYPSFMTISACGDHASMGHYSIPNKEELFDTTMKPCATLFDSGGQYFSGSTDIGRTIHFGEPNETEKQIYTLIAKGHIELATTVFPHGITGPQVDVFGRIYLWKTGLTYFHGTGHGVGHSLPVHEGPCRIDGTKLWAPFITTPLLPGMILSIEPTFNDGGLGLPFGMQIENLYEVKPADTPYNKGQFYKFEVISWAPIEKKMLNLDMMTEEEIEWVNNYHSKVYQNVSTFLKETYQPVDEKEKDEITEMIDWLKVKTSPICV